MEFTPLLSIFLFGFMRPEAQFCVWKKDNHKGQKLLYEQKREEKKGAASFIICNLRNF